jgi:hypothetical protein
MGWFKKAFKSATKIVKKTVSTVTKVVKSVAKSVVKVGKSVVKGISGVVKGIGSALGKLGPMASIALMAIPGFQAMAAGLWSSMGIPAGILQNMATGALTGFVTSGGDLKAAVMGGAMAGIGTAVGGAVKGFQAGDTLGGIQKAIMDPGKYAGITSFSEGLQQAKLEWGSFTDNVGKFFSGQGDGSVTNGAAKYADVSQTQVPTNAALADAKIPQVEVAPTGSVSTVGGVEVVNEAYYAGTQTPVAPVAYTSPVDMTNVAQQAQDTYYSNLVPDTTVSTLDQAANTKLGQNFNRLVSLGQQKNISALSYENLRGAMDQFGTDKVAAANYFESLAGKYEPLGIQPYTYGDWAAQTKEMAAYNVGAANIMGTTTQAASGQAAAVTDSGFDRKKIGDLLSKAGSLLAPDTAATRAAPSFITSVDPSDLRLGKGKGTGGSGGTLGFSDPIRQAQALLVAQAEQAAEEARKKAASGWGIA